VRTEVQIRSGTDCKPTGGLVGTSGAVAAAPKGTMIARLTSIDVINASNGTLTFEALTVDSDRE